MLVSTFNGYYVVVKSSRIFVRSFRPQARVVHVVPARNDVPLELHRVAATKYVTALLNMNIYITFTHCVFEHHWDFFHPLPLLERKRKMT